MQIKFVIDGEPCGKGRPKFARHGNFVSTYTPEKTARYEDRVRWDYKNQANGAYFEGQLNISIIAFFKMPNKPTKAKLKGMLDGSLRPTKKPDFDNIEKIVADSLNDIAYKDDSQIVSASIQKFYSDRPRVEVIIEEIIEMEDIK